MDRVAVVHNARSGTLLSGQSWTEERLTEVFGRHGVSVCLHAFDPATVARDVRGLLAADPGLDALIVAGGDGTVRMIAAQFGGTSVPLGILPAGTVNVLARDLGVPADLDAAVAALVGAPVHKIDVAVVNGQQFLCSSALAMMPHLGRLRERARGGVGWRTVLLLGRAARVLWRYPRMPLTVVVDGTEHDVRTRAIVVSNNQLSTSGPIHSRDRLDTGLLAVYVAQDRTNWDLLAVTAKVFDGTWLQDERLHTYLGQTVEIRSSRLSLMSVMSDGEISQLELPLRYEIQRRSLSVLAPRGAL